MRSLLIQSSVAFLVAAAPAVGAQSTAYEPTAFHVVGFSTGATSMSVSAINSQLTQAGFAGLSNDGISYGVTGHFAWGRAHLGVDVTRTTFGEEGLSNGRTDDLSATQFVGTAGYAIIAMPRISVFPILGVGIGQFDVTLRDRNGGTRTTTAQPTFAEVAQNPGASSTIAGRHLLFSVGVGGDLLVTRIGADHAGVVFGVRAGYHASPNRTTWTLAGREVLAGPDASAGGPFVRVVIGFGGR
jgi:hypothetical protein